MFWKIAVSIIWIGISAVGLLMIRQQRIDAVHDQAVIHARLLHKRQLLWQLRIETHEMLTPEHVAALIEQYSRENGVTFKPLLIDPCLPPVHVGPVIQSAQSPSQPATPVDRREVVG